jgi:hypothetical protein
LASAKNALSGALGGSGFLDLTAPIAESFAVWLQYAPDKTEVRDFDPGVLTELMSLVTTRMAANPKQAMEMQARVRPERAVRLLR